MKAKSATLGMLVGLMLTGSILISAQATPEFLDAMDDAEELMELQDYKEAIKAYREADRLSSGASFACKYGMARAFNRLGAFKNAEECARSALELAQSSMEKAAGFNLLGESLFAGGANEPAFLGQAAEAFRRVLELTPEEGNIARFNLGVTLLKLERDEEGIAMLEEYLEHEPNGKEAIQARSYLSNPLRARVPIIPDFEIVTLDGEYLTSDDLRGRVVLFDFWGTWCAPCVRAVPHLRSLNRKLSRESFLMLSVSNDNDEGVVRQFVAEHKMSWPQYVDDNGELIRPLGIETYPTYVLVDPNGVIIYRRSGWSSQIELEVSREARKALKALRQATSVE